MRQAVLQSLHVQILKTNLLALLLLLLRLLLSLLLLLLLLLKRLLLPLIVVRLLQRRQQLQIRCPMDCNDCHQPNCSRCCQASLLIEQSFIIVGRHFVQETHRKNATGQLVVYCFTNMSSTNHTIHNRLWNPRRWAAMHHSESRHVNIGPIANKSFTAPDGRHRIPYVGMYRNVQKKI